MARGAIELGGFRLELEGSEEFVSAQLSAWSSRLPDAIGGEQQVGGGSNDEPSDGGGDASQDASSASRRGKRVQSKPGGPSCAARIRDLIGEDFFKTTRKVPEISERLREKATPYESKHISAALIHTVQSGRLRRVKEGGVWSYVNP